MMNFVTASKQLSVFVTLLLSCSAALCQDSVYGRNVIKELSSEKYWGRGYTRDGMIKAATFIADEFKSAGLRPMVNNSYFQTLSYPVNIFPGSVALKVNGKALVPGKEFLVEPESNSVKAKGQLVAADSITYISRENNFVLLLTNKAGWSVSSEVAPYGAARVLASAIDGPPRSFDVDIENRFDSNFIANNVCGYVRGTAYPDSFVLITAHYDHLGGMGKDVYFPGANDNASGVASMLALARHFARHPAKYSVGFVAFTGEEIGLVGSKFFTENPPVPLSTIRFLLNMDLNGTGEKGITIVNATEFRKEFELLKKVNKKGNYLVAINERGRAANSDHYFFSEKGVPAFFFYTLGGSPAYHDVDDVEANLKLEEFNDLQKLVIDFVGGLSATK